MAYRTFDEFMKVVNKYMLNNIGAEADDLPDYCYYDSWSAGISAKETAEEAIEYIRECY